MRQIICCRRPTHLEQLASWHSWSDTVRGNIRNTVENLPVCLTAASPVFLNWRLRNVHYDMIWWYEKYWSRLYSKKSLFFVWQYLCQFEKVVPGVFIIFTSTVTHKPSWSREVIVLVGVLSCLYHLLPAPKEQSCHLKNEKLRKIP